MNMLMLTMSALTVICHLIIGAILFLYYCCNLLLSNCGDGNWYFHELALPVAFFILTRISTTPLWMMLENNPGGKGGAGNTIPPSGSLASYHTPDHGTLQTCEHHGLCLSRTYTSTEEPELYNTSSENIPNVYNAGYSMQHFLPPITEPNSLAHKTIILTPDANALMVRLRHIFLRWAYSAKSRIHTNHVTRMR